MLEGELGYKNSILEDLMKKYKNLNTEYKKMKEDYIESQLSLS